MAPPQPTRLGIVMDKLGPVEMKRGTEAMTIVSAEILVITRREDIVMHLKADVGPSMTPDTI